MDSSLSLEIQKGILFERTMMGFGQIWCKNIDCIHVASGQALETGLHERGNDASGSRKGGKSVIL
jgi:hypothetical protein